MTEVLDDAKARRRLRPARACGALASSPTGQNASPTWQTSAGQSSKPSEVSTRTAYRKRPPTNSTRVMYGSGAWMYSWISVMPSTESSKAGLSRWLSSAATVWKRCTPRPLPARLCLVMNGPRHLSRRSDQIGAADRRERARRADAVVAPAPHTARSCLSRAAARGCR